MDREWRLTRADRGVRVYDGRFAARVRGRPGPVAVVGRLVEYDDAPVVAYLLNPPYALRVHPKGSCLQLLKPHSPWFRLHWDKPAWDWRTARDYIEALLAQTCAGKPRKPGAPPGLQRMIEGAQEAVRRLTALLEGSP